MAGKINLPIVSKFDPSGIFKAQGGLDGLARGMKNFALAGAAALAGASVGLAVFAVDAMKAADESAKVTRGLENMISNSEAFGKSANSIKSASKVITDFTQQFALLTGISDETFNSLATSFLAAPNIAKMGTDAVNNLIKISANAAAATGKDLESVGTALSKALEEPENALAKLARANIFLSDEQKNTYQSMIDLSDTAGAQAYLIEELGKKYEGAAEAAASPWAKLKETFEMFKELVGNELSKALVPVIPQIQAAVNAMIADPAFGQMLAEVANSFVEMAPALVELLPSLVELGMKMIPLLITTIPLLLPIIEFLTDLFEGMTVELEPLTEDLNNFWYGLFVLISPIGKIIEGVTQMNKYWGDFGQVLGGVFSPLGSLISFFVNLDGWIQKVVDGWNSFIELFTGSPVDPSSYAGNAPIRPAMGRLTPMANGGIVMGPTPALVGEAGPEAIIPLDRLGGLGGGTTNNYNINVTAGVGDPAAIGQQIVTYIKKFERSGGPVFVSA